MYVCLCNGVTERDIRNAAAAGCKTLGELTMLTGCGMTCGSCLPMAEELLAEPAAGSVGAGSNPVLTPAARSRQGACAADCTADKSN